MRSWRRARRARHSGTGNCATTETIARTAIRRAQRRAGLDNAGNMARSLPRGRQMDKRQGRRLSGGHGMARGRHLVGRETALANMPPFSTCSRPSTVGTWASSAVAPRAGWPRSCNRARSWMRHGAHGWTPIWAATRSTSCAGRAAEGDGRPAGACGAECGLRRSLSFSLPERHAYPALHAPQPRAARRAGGGSLGRGLSRLGTGTARGDGLWPRPVMLCGDRRDAGTSPMSRRAAGAPSRARARATGPTAFCRCPVSCAACPIKICRASVLGLRTTGHFLSDHLAPSLGGGKPLPPARQRLVDLIVARAAQARP